MSTFLGIPKEFPEIRIDYFKEQPRTLPPKACFLSHVHSDHLQGLENYIGPVVYCSPATKRLLLRLEKKSVRLARLCNEVEIEPQRMYRNLGPENGRDVLRAIPYNTPTVIDLDPCQKITVTLFDANHCPGSTMFLIESDRKAILYTGDVRAENRWLEGLRQNPILIAYTRGWKKLDCIYLDTTFCGPSPSYAIFPSKAEGTDLLIDAVSKYPADTVFHFNAWTYGYEDLWIALASAFNTKIHVDKYRYDIFQSIGNAAVYDYGPCLTGYGIASIDNRDKIVLSEGCLALDPTCTRFHSCERGYVCDGRRSRQVVYIHPSVSSQIREPGAGYPRDGLDDKSSEQSAKQEVKTEDDNAVGPDTPGLSDSLEIITEHPILSTTGEKLPSFIEVPYSRHSSYTECCNLVALFQPMEVFPCVVTDWMVTHPHALRELFGKYCFQKMYFFFDDIERFRYRRDEVRLDEVSITNEVADIKPARQRPRKGDDVRIIESVRPPGLQMPVSAPGAVSRKRKMSGRTDENDQKIPTQLAQDVVTSSQQQQFSRTEDMPEWSEDYFFGLTSEISRRAALAVLEKGDETWFDIRLFSTTEIGRDVFL